MDVANIFPTLEDVIKAQVYSEVDGENEGLEEKDPIEYHRLCSVAYEKVHTFRLEKLKNVIRVSLGGSIRMGLKRYSKGYAKLTEGEQRERDKKALSLVSKMCCNYRSSILGYWREYNQMRKSSD